MTRRLLVVERSDSMRRALVGHLVGEGFAVDDTAAHDEAVARLEQRFTAFASDLDGVVMGWPAGSDAEVEPLLSRLEQGDLIDLPVVVMSTDLRAATRAWVASRERTAMLAWKRFGGIDSLLAGLLPPEGTSTVAGATSAAPGRTDGGAPSAVGGPGLPAKFDNADIHLLVVDDSATIRRSLQDLFHLHGYTVSLASGQLDALEIARRVAIDVAIVDFYLEDGTGDQLCRELVADAATGDMVCAVLTGTYSDHIIRRSLRAGALECLFKSESSELLLNRVDALSRFVRQRRTLDREHKLLEQVFDVIAGPAVVLDRRDEVRLVSAEALEQLGHDRPAALIGRTASALLADATLPPDDGELHRLTLRLADGSRAAFMAERRALGDGMSSDGSVLQFAPVAEVDLGSTGAQAPDAPGAPVGRGARAAAARPPLTAGAATPAAMPPGGRTVASLGPDAAPWLRLVARYLDGSEPVEAEVSLLLVRTCVPGKDGTYSPLAQHAEVQRRLTPAVLRLYRRPGHVADLGNGLYGLLLRHQDEPQSWLLVRKLMQLINAALESDGGPRLVSHGALKRLQGPRDDSERLVQHCLDAVAKATTLGPNRALLLDPRRLLAVYPATT